MFFFRSLAISFSMYSKIPMPQFEWKEKDMRWAICFFPFVGLVLAVFETGISSLATVAGLPAFVRAVLYLLVPLVVTGGIHLDGFMDTSDALSSYREKSVRLKILKDPHIGSFAVLKLITLIIASLAALYLVQPGNLYHTISLALSLVLSRGLSGLSVVSFPLAKKEGTLYAFAKSASAKWQRMVFVLEIISVCLTIVLLNPIPGTVQIIAAGLVFFYYYVSSRKNFGGITGDTAGYFLCLAEFFMLASNVTASLVVQKCI